MSRKIRRKRKENKFFTLQELKKRFSGEGKENLRFPVSCSNITCGNENGTNTPCIAVLQYKSYSWGVTKEGKVFFCCRKDGFNADDWSFGNKILTEYKPELETIIRKK